jgi:hypothetical protein
MVFPVFILAITANNKAVPALASFVARINCAIMEKKLSTRTDPLLPKMTIWHFQHLD